MAEQVAITEEVAKYVRTGYLGLMRKLPSRKVSSPPHDSVLWRCTSLETGEEALVRHQTWYGARERCSALLGVCSSELVVERASESP